MRIITESKFLEIIKKKTMSNTCASLIKIKCHFYLKLFSFFNVLLNAKVSFLKITVYRARIY